MRREVFGARATVADALAVIENKLSTMEGHLEGKSASIDGQMAVLRRSLEQAEAQLHMDDGHGGARFCVAQPITDGGAGVRSNSTAAPHTDGGLERPHRAAGPSNDCLDGAAVRTHALGRRPLGGIRHWRPMVPWPQ